MSNQEQIGHDAEEFGVHVRLGGWRLGLLVARSVEKGKGSRSAPRGVATPRDDFEKWSASKFAQKAKTSHDRVLRYLQAWDDAALDGWVPESALLIPGEELDNFDLENLPDWSDYYSSHVGTTASKLDAYTVAAEEAGTTTAEVNKIAVRKNAMAAAIKADPAVRLAAREAIEQVEMKQARSKARSTSTSDEPLTDLVSLSTTVRATKRNLQELLTKVIEFKDYTDGRRIVGEYVDELQHYLDAIRQAAMGNSLDAELARLMEQGV